MSMSAVRDLFSHEDLANHIAGQLLELQGQASEHFTGAGFLSMFISLLSTACHGRHHDRAYYLGRGHPGVLVAKVRYFGVKSAKVPTWADGHQTC